MNWVYVTFSVRGAVSTFVKQIKTWGFIHGFAVIIE